MSLDFGHGTPSAPTTSSAAEPPASRGVEPRATQPVSSNSGPPAGDAGAGGHGAAPSGDPAGRPNVLRSSHDSPASEHPSPSAPPAVVVAGLATVASISGREKEPHTSTPRDEDLGTCPPFAAKAVWGLRYTMEDKWAAVPNLLQVSSPWDWRVLCARLLGAAARSDEQRWPLPACSLTLSPPWLLPQLQHAPRGSRPFGNCLCCANAGAAGAHLSSQQAEWAGRSMRHDQLCQGADRA